MRKQFSQTALGNCYGLKLPKCWLQFKKYIYCVIFLYFSAHFSSLWPCVCACLSVCPSQVGVQSKRMDASSWFWPGGFFRPILRCVVRKFRYPNKHGYFQWMNQSIYLSTLLVHNIQGKGKGKGKRSIAVRKKPHRYGNSRAIWDHTVLPATRQRWHFRRYPSRSWYSIKQPRREARLSWPSWLITARGGITLEDCHPSQL